MSQKYLTIVRGTGSESQREYRELYARRADSCEENLLSSLLSLSLVIETDPSGLKMWLLLNDRGGGGPNRVESK